MLKEIRTRGDIILFIDELHTLVGAGAAEGAIDAASILKPMLARGELQTDRRHHARRVPQAPREGRRPRAPLPEDRRRRAHRGPHDRDPEGPARPLRGPPPGHDHRPGPRGRRPTWPTATSPTATSPTRPSTSSTRPARRLRIKRMETPADYKELENELAGVVEAKKKAVEAQNFEEAGQLRDKEKELLAAKEGKEREIKDSGVDLFDEVDEEAIAEVLSMWTGIPVYKLTEEETQKLLRMEDELHKRVIGQEDSIKAVAQAVRRTRAGLKDPKRPSGCFIFLGPSGVGKTELAKTLAEFLFGDETAMISLDMSEYMEKHTVSRLVGSPPGYVGYEEGGQLTEAVRRKPFCVVLFDEIEKAHPDVFNTLLQILEEGRLTDAQGRSVDFRNTVLIMTSNLGTADLRKANLGFGKADEAITYERMKEKVNDALKQHFRPEFLNRIDETIVFHELSKDEVTQIVDLHDRPHPEAARGPGHRHRAHAGRQAAPRRPGLRPHPGRPPAAPGHPAPHRGPAVRAAPLQGVPRRRDHRRRRRARRRRPASWRSPSGRSRASSRRRWSWPRRAPRRADAQTARGEREHRRPDLGAAGSRPVVHVARAHAHPGDAPVRRAVRPGRRRVGTGRRPLRAAAEPRDLRCRELLVLLLARHAEARRRRSPRRSGRRRRSPPADGRGPGPLARGPATSHGGHEPRPARGGPHRAVGRGAGRPRRADDRALPRARPAALRGGPR